MDRIRILATSDVHGYVTPFSYANRKEVDGGLVKIATQIEALRDENTILVDNGDTIQGSPMLYYHHLFRSETTNPMAKILNAMKYDYVNTGNHEFNYGYENAKKYYEDLDAKWICGNIRYSNESINKPYVVHSFPNGRKIALIAAVTDYITNWEQPKNIVNVTFDKVFDFISNAVSLVKTNEQVDAIIVLYHGGYEKDLETGVPTEALTGENVGHRLCSEIEGITAVVSGHQHRSIAGYCEGVCTTQTAFNAKELAMIDITFDGDEIKAVPSLIKPAATYSEALLGLIEDIESETQEWLDKPLGELDEGDLLIHDIFDARVHKHPMVSFLNQVQLERSGADLSGVALANEVVGFNHFITMRDIVSTYVFPNTLAVLEMTGANVLAYLEQCAEYFDLDEEGNFKVSKHFMEPKPQHYNYDMIDGEGVRYTIHVGNPVGQRVSDVYVKNEPLDMNKMYLVVVNNYRATGGGNFEMFKVSKVHEEIQTDVVECIADYIQKVKVIHVNHEDSIKVVK